MPAVVTDSGCLIALERIGRLAMLPALFGEVFIPPAVAAEFGGAFPWLRVVPVPDAATSHAVLANLDPGEREAIALARELRCLLIIDELRGRAAARRLGVAIRGTAGMLVLAKRQGVIEAVAPVIHALDAAEFYLDAETRRDVLREAGEL